MKKFYKSLFCLIVVFFPQIILAGQNDYDGKWNVEFTCSVNSKNQRPGFSYSEVWDIKGNSIHHTYKTTTKFGAEQTVWDGQISNQNISLKADATRDNGDAWSWLGQGKIYSAEAFQIIAIMNDKSNSKIRDCVIKFGLIDAAVGSLAYLKANPQVPAQKVEPTLKSKEIAPVGLPAEIKEDPIKKPIEESGKDAPTPQAQESNIEPKPTPVLSSEIDYQQYLIAIGVILLLLVIGFILIRKKRDAGSDQSRKLQDELKAKEFAQELIAKELERDKEKLQQAERDLKIKAQEESARLESIKEDQNESKDANEDNKRPKRMSIIYIITAFFILGGALFFFKFSGDPADKYFNADIENNAKCYGVLLAKIKTNQSLSVSQGQLYSTVQKRFLHDLALMNSCLTKNGVNLSNVSDEDGNKCVDSSLSKNDGAFLKYALGTVNQINNSPDRQWTLGLNHMAFCGPIGITQN